LLHQVLDSVEKEGNADVFSWIGNGRAIKVHDSALFVKLVMSKYFPYQSHYKSFLKQLGLYGFQRILKGPAKGAYMHPDFVKDDMARCLNIKRKKVRSASQLQNLAKSSSSESMTTKGIVPRTMSLMDSTTIHRYGHHDHGSTRGSTQNAQFQLHQPLSNLAVDATPFTSSRASIQQEYVAAPAPSRAPRNTNPFANLLNDFQREQGLSLLDDEERAYSSSLVSSGLGYDSDVEPQEDLFEGRTFYHPLG
jgi:hypothetical protein